MFAESPTDLLEIWHQERTASEDERGRSQGKCGSCESLERALRDDSYMKRPLGADVTERYEAVSRQKGGSLCLMAQNTDQAGCCLPEK